MPAPPLSTWSLNGQSLELPAGMTREEAQSAGDLAVLTAFAVETIRQKGFTVAISIIKNTRELARPLEILRKLDGFNEIPVSWDLVRQERQAAIAAYITLPKTNLMPCRQCQDSQRSGGPCKDCVASGKTFKGACTNCHYSGRGGKCSFVLDRRLEENGAQAASSTKKRRLDGSTSSESPSPLPTPTSHQVVLTRAVAAEASDEKLAEWEEIIALEKTRRRLGTVTAVKYKTEV